MNKKNIQKIIKNITDEYSKIIKQYVENNFGIPYTVNERLFGNNISVGYYSANEDGSPKWNPVNIYGGYGFSTAKEKIWKWELNVYAMGSFSINESSNEGTYYRLVSNILEDNGSLENLYKEYVDKVTPYKDTLNKIFEDERNAKLEEEKRLAKLEEEQNNKKIINKLSSKNGYVVYCYSDEKTPFIYRNKYINILYGDIYNTWEEAYNFDREQTNYKNINRIAESAKIKYENI